MSRDEGDSSSILASAAEKALVAVRRSSNGQATIEPQKASPSQSPAPGNKENVPTYASVAVRRMLETELPPRRPASMPPIRGSDAVPGLQMKPSVESLDSQAGPVFASPLSHELTSHELLVEPLSHSTYSDPGREYLSQTLSELDLHTAPGSQIHSRRPSLAMTFDPARDLSASTPSLVPYPAPLPYDENITVTRASRIRSAQRAPIMEPGFFPSVPQPQLLAHPSAIMPGAIPLAVSVSDGPLLQPPERPGSEALSRGSSGLSHQSWATEPVRYPPRFSPAPSFQHAVDIARSGAPLIPQQQVVSGAGGWTGEMPILGSALQSDSLYPPLTATRPRVGSVDERLQSVNPGWNPEIEPAQLLHFGGHRVDVRDARQRLHESGRLQTPRHVPSYQLYHPNLSGPLIQDGAHLYAPAPPLYGTRTRSGSSPPRPNYDGLGVRFA